MTDTVQSESSAKSLTIDGYTWGTGRRKTAVARIRMKPGDGKFEVNGRPFGEYFPTQQMQLDATAPLNITSTRNKYDVFATITGGGVAGAAGAVALGIGRVLKDLEPVLEPTLREAGFLTRDSRMKERKKYGLRGARRAFQFSKR